jgi:hypothetical protein
MVTAVRAEEHVTASPAVLGHVRARIPWLALGLPSEQPGQERREIDRQARFPVGASARVVLGRQPVERAPELAKLPLNVNLAGVYALVFQAEVSPQRSPV